MNDWYSGTRPKKRLFLTGLLFLILQSTILQSTEAFAGCEVTKWDGTTRTVGSYRVAGTDITLNSCRDLYHPDHLCAQANRPAVCATHDWLKLPDWSAAQDLVIVPHRGIWGYQTNSQGEFLGRGGAPENSIAAITAAAEAGYKVVELDVVLARDDDTDSTTNERVLMFSHYFQLNRFTDYSGPTSPGTPNAECPAAPCFNTGGEGFIWNTDPQKLLSLHVKDRDGNDTASAFATLEAALIEARNHNMVVLLDPKTATKHFNQDGECDMFCYIKGGDRVAEWKEIYDRAVDLAEAVGALANVVVKTHSPFTYGEIAAVVGEADMRKVLWSPQSSKRQDDPQAEVLAWVDDWADNHEQEIAVWDTSVFAPTWELGQSFTYDRGDGRGNVRYDNILDYLKVNSNKRAGLWQIEPGGRRGVMDSYSEWQMVGNIVESGKQDLRGDFITTIGYQWAGHAAITTDRQDIYRQILHWQ